MTDKKQVNLRLKEETIEKLKTVADEEQRSFNNLLEVIIAEFLENRYKKS